LPWNWFSPDRVAQLEKVEARTTAAETVVVKAAQVENAKTIEALKTAPQADRSVQVASRTSANAQLLLDKAVGGISPEEALKLRDTVAALVSENAELRAAGEASQQSAERTLARQAGKLDELRTDMAALTEKLKSADLAHQATAAKYRKLWFWIYVIAGGWLALQLLAGASKFYPALSPLAKAAGHVTAPILQAMNNRVHTAVGKALAAADKLKDGTADILRQHLDATTDEAEQRQIREAYEISART